MRYVRRCIADGRIEDPEVREAITIRLAHIASGGYDRKARRLAKATRVETISRSGGLCVTCGAPGEEIDHVDGPSPDEQNLQLLCRTCHTRKTMASIRPVTAESVEYENVKALYERFWTSVEAKRPTRPCHNQVTWSKQWRTVLKAREFHVLLG